MKKLLVFLVFILILGGIVFGFGWVQIQVPVGSAGVLRSKTHGVDPEAIVEGRFQWVWYRLIPTNTQIEVFQTGTHIYPINVTGSLPSGTTYSSFAGMSQTFDYRVQGTLSFRINPDSLPGLVKAGGVTDQASLDAYTERLANQMQNAIVLQVMEAAERAVSVETLLANPEEIAAALSLQFDSVENLTVSLRTLSYPDYTLYTALRSLYQEYLTAQKGALAAQAVSEANRHISSQVRMDELARYGELLTRYPVLLQLPHDSLVPPSSTAQSGN
jgi:hypothetical protein